MTRTLKYALTAVLGLVVALPAIAQDQFPDVPENHWAYEALARMKREGLLVGYPDGLFRGGRPATRYELAVAVHATYVHLKNLIDGLNSQIAAINEQIQGVAKQSDLDNLRQALTALQEDVNRLRSQDIADLKRMAATFEKELASLGVDVQQMRKDLADLSDRVTNLENRLPVDISGDMNLMMLSGYGDEDFGGLPGITVDGRPVGVGSGSYSGDIVGGTRDMQFYHEGSLTLTSAMKSGPRFKLTTVVGNMLGSGAFGDQSNTMSGSPFSEGDAEFYVQNFSVAFDTSLWGMGLNAEAGRVGYKVAPYVFMRPDVTPYYANDRWDSGEWNFDGAVLGLNFGTAKVKVFGGRPLGADGNSAGVGGSSLQGMSAGPISPGARPVGLESGTIGVDQFLGVHLNMPISDSGSINLAYLWLDSNTIVPTIDGPVNRTTVFGGDIKFNFGNFMIDAGYAQSDTGYNDDQVIDEDNAAFYAKIGLESGRWGASVGYRSIEPNFGAPGDWGRLGIWFNPVDLEGVMGMFHYNLNDDMRFRIEAESYRGTDTDSSALTDNDEVTRYVVGVDYKLATNYDLALGVEEVRWDLADFAPAGNGGVIERWYNVGLGWSLSDNAKLKFLWQVSDYKALEVPAFQVLGAPAVRGGLITTQLSVKF